MTRRARPAARAPAPPRTARPRTEQDGRTRILTVAIRHFSERGYEGTTTASVARDAGVTQPLVHHHFGSKEGLWRAAMDELFAPARAFRAAEDLPPADRLLDAAERFVRFTAGRPEATRVIAREGASPSPRLTWLVDRYLREPFQEIVGVVRASQRAGLVAPGLRPDLLLFLLLGAGSHLFDVTALAQESLGIDARSPRTREDFVALVRELLQRGLLRSGATGRSRGGRAT